MDSSMLRVSGLCKSFGAIRALNEIDVEVVKGQIHGIIGPNGSGKRLSSTVSPGCSDRTPVP